MTQEHMFYYNGLMSLWRNLFSRLGILPSSDHHTYELDATLYAELENLAQREQRDPNEVVSGFIVKGLDERYSQEDKSRLWQSLSAREQKVSALACLGYTNRKIATKLGISDETVKTHLHNALVKFNLHSRLEMRMLLANWDLSDWDRQ